MTQPQYTPDFLARFWAKVDTSGDCWLWTGATARHGYGKIALKVGGRHRYLTASRVSWELANGPIPDGLQINHRCDNPPCVNPAHLYAGTQLENQQDVWARGRQRTGNWARGSGTYSARLTEADIPVIRALLASGVTKVEIGRRYGITDVSVYAIAVGRTWRHVP